MLNIIKFNYTEYDITPNVISHLFMLWIFYDYSELSGLAINAKLETSFLIFIHVQLLKNLNSKNCFLSVEHESLNDWINIHTQLSTKI